ncbi:hypothetical protein D770_21975 [Flammeovirgaceae bacterium 311]|nr:hypothetical protein D770_21975 [Flammeovirgaceae bacterium 311]
MKVFKQILFYFIIFVSVLVILASLLSLIYDLAYWYSKVVDFPRLQYLIVALICLLIFVLLNKKWGFASVFLAVGLLTAITIHATRILPYIVGDKPVPDVAQEAISQENSVGILIANVLITNKEAADFLEIVEQTDPDMLLVMEVDQWWVNQLQGLKVEYPYIMEYPLENAYGMALYSRFPLKDTEIKFFNHDDVPSFHAKVILPSGEAFRFHGMHPVAPVPSDKYPDNVGEEEVGLLKVGQLVAAESLPSIVAGDFNDVSWSHTSRLFGDAGSLKNVRLGRGLYNSFNAKSLIMRWPLDHFFVTREFALLELERLRKFNSDHFPMFAKLVLQKQ